MKLSGRALPVPASAKAVPWSGEVRTNGRPERDVDAAVEGQGLERDQRLVVVHGDHRVVGARASA